MTLFKHKSSKYFFFVTTQKKSETTDEEVCVSVHVYSVLLPQVDIPAQHLSIKAAGEEVTHGVVLCPRHRGHHLTVTLRTTSSLILIENIY